MSVDDALVRAWFRAHNASGTVTLHRSDDTNPVQSAQIEGYSGELRDNMQRHQQFGMSTVPLPGAKGYAVYQSSHRGLATVLSVEDPRYRPVGQQPGCVTFYMVDNARGDGTGGTMRRLLTGAAGWVCSLFGKTINVGDSSTTAIAMSGTSITLSGSSITINGNVQVKGSVTATGAVQGNVPG